MKFLISITFFLTIICPTLQAEPINIVCTTGMITDITQNIAGERASVVGLMGSGVDPHLYKPTRSDIAKLSRADIVFYNGLLLEGKLADALIRVASSGRKVHAVTELIDNSYLLEPPEFSGHYDPHVWMDPKAWGEAVKVVRDSLISFDSEGRKFYETNANTYFEKLAQLDKYSTATLATVPEKSRILVTAHDAFNYFGKRFNFKVVGIQGLSTDSEAGVRDIEKIVSLLVDKKIKAVFTESTVSDRNVQALIEGAAARGHEVQIGGSLYSDAMGQPETFQGTYIGMIDHNVTTIAKALGGKAAEDLRLKR